MLSDEGLLRYTSLDDLQHKTLSKNSMNVTKGILNEQRNRQTERQKLYTCWHKCQGGGIILMDIKQNAACVISGMDTFQLYIKYIFISYLLNKIYNMAIKIFNIKIRLIIS